LDGCEDGNGEVSSEVCVRDESSEEAEHEGCAEEVGDGVGGGGAAEVHGGGEVGDEVDGDAERGEALVELDDEDPGGGEPATGGGTDGGAALVVPAGVHHGHGHRLGGLLMRKLRHWIIYNIIRHR
jgi:hypothetical protein